MSPDRVSALAADFGRAAARFDRGEPDRVMVILLPLGLSEVELAQRVRGLVAFGALVVSVCGGEVVSRHTTPAAEVIADLLVAAVGERDMAAIRDVLSASGPAELVDVLVELVARCAATAGRLLVERTPLGAPGGRPVPSPRGGSR